MSDSDLNVEDGRKSSTVRRSTRKELEARRNTQGERPEFFDDEYKPFDNYSKKIQSKIRLREKATTKRFRYILTCLINLKYFPPNGFLASKKRIV